MLAAALALAPAARAEAPPSVTTGNASELSLTSATLAGSVESAAPMQGCWFEYGIAPHFETTVPCRPASPEGQFVAASAEASGLQMGTTYTWRLAAANAAGAAHGLTGAFTTLGYPLGEAPVAVEPLSSGPELGSTPAQIPAAHGHFEDGLYVAYCASSLALAAKSGPRAGTAMANHTGWPAVQCLKMDKGTYGFSHTLVGLPNVHNFLLGGYGDDTIWGGNDGDVIWGDYQPSGQHTTERDWLHGGAGDDWIYSSHGRNEIWTGAGDDHVALVYGWGTVDCNGPGLKTLVMRLLKRNRHWRLVGCRHIQIVPYKA
jgi:Ca2+-binding RTX toxin-like protein